MATLNELLAREKEFKRYAQFVKDRLLDEVNLSESLRFVLSETEMVLKELK